MILIMFLIVGNALDGEAKMSEYFSNYLIYISSAAILLANINAVSCTLAIRNSIRTKVRNDQSRLLVRVEWGQICEVQ
jgi:hypothetical protein